MDQNKFQCELCGNSYQNEMRVGKSNEQLIQCYDCLFSMNFNDKNIINGSMGINLKEYLQIATKYHDQYNEIPCNRMSDTGGCYICMNLLNIPFDTLEEKEIKIEEEKSSSKSSNSEKPSDEYITHALVIEHDNIYDIENLLVKV